MRNLLIMLCCFSSLTIQSQTIKVAAAANLRYVLEEIKLQYEQQHNEISIEITLGSSGALTQQIINGAPFDFFMAADVKFPQKLKEQGCASGNVATYAFGKLAIWSNKLDLSKGIDAIKEPGVVKIAIAKPELAPYGAASVECLKFYNLYEPLKSKLVYADNIAQTIQFAESGNAEIAFVALSLLTGPEMKDKGNFYVIDSKSYKPFEQACVLLKKWEPNREAKKFMEYVLSDASKPVFEKHGYIVP